MAKRSTKRRQAQGVLNVQEFQRDDRRQRNLQVLEGGYQPANDTNRAQSFVKNVRPKSKGQSQLLEAIDSHALVLALGPAGTGKTYLAITKAVEALESGKVGRIVLSRPAVESTNICRTRRKSTLRTSVSGALLCAASRAPARTCTFTRPSSSPSAANGSTPTAR
jgi:hypothetical protein